MSLKILPIVIFLYSGLLLSGEPGESNTYFNLGVYKVQEASEGAELFTLSPGISFARKSTYEDDVALQSSIRTAVEKWAATRGDEVNSLLKKEGLLPKFKSDGNISIDLNVVPDTQVTAFQAASDREWDSAVKAYEKKKNKKLPFWTGFPSKPYVSYVSAGGGGDGEEVNDFFLNLSESDWNKIKEDKTKALQIIQANLDSTLERQKKFVAKARSDGSAEESGKTAKKGFSKPGGKHVKAKKS